MSISTWDFEYIRTIVRENSAIVLEPGKEYLAEARLVPIARQQGFSSLEDMIRTLRQNNNFRLQKAVIDAMTTNETSFFRDVAPFDALRTQIIPQLMRNHPDKRLNFWCAATSSGQEPFSVAMILREHFPELRNWQVRFVGTDLSTQMIQRCREGKYSQMEVNRGLPAPMLSRYFQRSGLEWQVVPDILQMFEFHEMNLAGGWWPGMSNYDIVFMRNVLIYFDVETKKSILRKIRSVLRPDGYLFLGGAETTMNLDDNFERVPLDRAGIYRIRR